MRRPKHAEYTFTLTVDLKAEDDVAVEFTVSYVAGTPDVWYLPNGDPGYPGDASEIEILSATREDTGAPLAEDDFHDLTSVEDAVHDAADDAWVQDTDDF